MSDDIEKIISGLSEAARSAVEGLVAENLALRCLMGGGCDANDDGLHVVVRTGSGEFCCECGEMTRRGKSTPWFDESRLNRTIRRLRVRSVLGGEG